MKESFEKINSSFDSRIIINEQNYVISEGDYIYYFSNKKNGSLIEEYNEENYNEYLKDEIVKGEKERKNKDNFHNGFLFMISSCVNNYQNYSLFEKEKEIDKNKKLEEKVEENSLNFFNLYKESPGIKIFNHIIYVGSFKDFTEIMLILRQYSKRIIIFFSQEPLNKEKTKEINKYENVYYYFGNFVNIGHISKLQVEKCFKVVILHLEEDNSLFSDSNIIVLARIIRDKYPSAKLLIEFDDENSLRLLDKRPGYRFSNVNNSSNYYNYTFWPNVITGTVFPNSLFYTLFSKSFYDDTFLNLMKNIAGLRTNKEVLKFQTFRSRDDFFNCYSEYSNYNSRNHMIHTLKINKEIKDCFETYGKLIWYIFTFTPEIVPLGIEKQFDKNENFNKNEAFNLKPDKGRTLLSSLNFKKNPIQIFSDEKVYLN